MYRIVRPMMGVSVLKCTDDFLSLFPKQHNITIICIAFTLH